ncbi:MAG: amidohydrolase family protein [Bacteroidales bacterium]
MVISKLLVQWRAFLIITAFQYLVFFAGCSNQSHNDEAAYVFRNVNVIDAVNGLRKGQSVVVSGNKIVQVDPVEKIKEPSGVRVIDCRGKYLIPGLWDAHIHLLDGDALTPELMFPLFIVNGITYVRDTSGYLDMLLALREKASRLKGMAPRVFITGHHIDGLQYSWDHSFRVVSAEQTKVVMDSLINAGVDHIKVYELPSPEVFFEVLSIASRKGLKVSAHVPLTMDVIEASNAGLGTMEHMRNLELSCSSDWDSLLKSRQKMIAEAVGKSGNELRNDIYRAQRLHAIKTQDEKRREIVLKCLADNNTWQVPTLTLTASAEHNMWATKEWRETFRYLPEPTRSEWQREAVRRAGQSPSEEDFALASWAYDMIPRLIDAGIGIMAGTDMPLAQLTPGFSLHQELALLVRAGLTPLQAFEAATLRPAQFFGLENQQGSIAKGMNADLVLLDASPLENITNTQRINAVMRDGHFHTRDDLDEMLYQLENPR